MVLAVVQRSAVGAKIFEARTRLGWSLITLEGKTAEAGTRVGASTIRGIENGSQNPVSKSLRGLAAALKLDYEELMKLAGYLPGQEDEETAEWPPEVQRFAERLIAINPKKRNRLIPAIDHLLEIIEEEEETEEDRLPPSS